MRYTSESHIVSLADVKAFAHHIVVENHLFGWHPDDGFDASTVATSEVDIYNRLLAECFDICTSEGADIYGIFHNALYSHLNELRHIA